LQFILSSSPLTPDEGNKISHWSHQPYILKGAQLCWSQKEMQMRGKRKTESIILTESPLSLELKACGHHSYCHDRNWNLIKQSSEPEKMRAEPSPSFLNILQFLVSYWIKYSWRFPW
jgi:superoxide dismutase